jgi:hypothetical protein
VTAVVENLSSPGAVIVTPRARTWAPAQWLALIAVPLLAIQFWTWGAWLLDGPVQLTKYRDTSLSSFKVAIGYQVFAWIVMIAILRGVYREVRRERKWTLDAMFCVAGLLTYFWDPLSNLAQPLFMYSSQWVNLADWTGYVPFNKYPDGGRLPEAVAFTPCFYVIGFLTASRIMHWVVERVRSRRPELSNRQAFLVMWLVGGLFDAAFEVPLYLTHLWAYPGTPDVGILAHSGQKYPLSEFIIAGFGIASFAAIRNFKDDKGRSLVERGMERFNARRRTFLSQLALVGAFNGIFLVLSIIFAVLGLFAGPVKAMPDHLINGSCDAPGWENTNYGPCFGTDKYQVPLPGNGSTGERPKNRDEDLNGDRQCPTCDEVKAPGRT